MNDLTTTAAVDAALGTNSLALTKAREDAALFERLKAAAGLADRLAKEGQALTALKLEISTAEAKAKRDALFAMFGKITVSGCVDDGLLSANWTIIYERLAYDTHAHRNIMKEFRVDGFPQLERHHPEAYRYLVEANPERIPDAIMNLSPGNPAEAIAILCQAKARGYLRNGR